MQPWQQSPQSGTRPEAPRDPVGPRPENKHRTELQQNRNKSNQRQRNELKYISPPTSALNQTSEHHNKLASQSRNVQQSHISPESQIPKYKLTVTVSDAAHTHPHLSTVRRQLTRAIQLGRRKRSSLVEPSRDVTSTGRPIRSRPHGDNGRRRNSPVH